MPTGHSAASAISIPTTTPRPTGRRRDKRAVHAAYLFDCASRSDLRPLPSARKSDFLTRGTESSNLSCSRAASRPSACIGDQRGFPRKVPLRSTFRERDRPLSRSDQGFESRSLRQRVQPAVQTTVRTLQRVDDASGHRLVFDFRAPKGKKPVDMLLDREVDAALLASNMPNDPRLKTLIPDADGAALAWWKKYGVTPINHMYVVKQSLCQARPDVVREIYRMLLASRAAGPQPAPGSLNMAPSDVEANRRSLEPGSLRQ